VSFGFYILGYLIVIGGLTYVAALMHARWIVAGAIVLAGLGIVTGRQGHTPEGLMKAPFRTGLIETNHPDRTEDHEQASRDRSSQDRAAHAIASFSGSMPFVYLHVAWFRSIPLQLIDHGCIARSDLPLHARDRSRRTA
jgi:hypothetical protein